MVGVAAPEKVTTRSVPGTTRPFDQRATWTAPIASGAGPSALDRRSRIVAPPRLRCTMVNTVWSWKDGVGGVTPGSGSDGLAPQLPTQFDWATADDAKNRATANRPAAGGRTNGTRRWGRSLMMPPNWPERLRAITSTIPLGEQSCNFR